MEYIKAKGRMFRLNTWFRFQNPFYGFGSPVRHVRKVLEGGVLGDGPVRCVFGRSELPEGRSVTFMVRPVNDYGRFGAPLPSVTFVV